MKLSEKIAAIISIHALREEGDNTRIRPRFTLSHFYPRPPRGGRPKGNGHGLLPKRFLSTPSARRATGRGKIQRGLDAEFLSTPSARRATCPPESGRCPAGNFYPRPPRGGRQMIKSSQKAVKSISIHALREEGDRSLPLGGSGITNFYPRPPRGGRRQPIQYSFPCLLISIHALREEGDCCFLGICQWKSISIHALREEGDARYKSRWQRSCYFYPRPPRGGRPTCTSSSPRAMWISIHALREEGDFYFLAFLCTSLTISIHALREEGDVRRDGHRRTQDISIHALREEGDHTDSRIAARILPFLSTPSARRATGAAHPCLRPCHISIHALREEGDRTGADPRCCGCYFYPRPPRGGRPCPCRGLRQQMQDFYPRPPRGGRRAITFMQRKSIRFLSTPSARRATGKPFGSSISMCYFYPRPPRGGRLTNTDLTAGYNIFLSTPSARRATVHPGRRFRLREIFLSTPSARRATGSGPEAEL